MANTYVKDFTEGKVTPQLIKFATPLFLASLLQVVYNMVDMIVVGQVMGKPGLSAVSVGGDLCNFLTFVAMGFSNAGQVIISKYIGSNEREKISKFIGTMFSSLMIGAVVFGILGIALREPLLVVMNTPDEAYEQALNYSTVCLVGLVFVYGYNMTSAVLRGMGDSKRPFIFIAIASIVNIILDIVFVVFCDMGAGGAALATIISQAVSFIVSCIFILKRKEKYGFVLNLDAFRIRGEYLGSLFKLGFPMAIKNASIQFSKLFVNSFVNGYGVAISAFAGVANKLNSISNLVSNSMNAAGSSMVGQNIGAKKYDRVKKILLSIAVITCSIAILFSVLIILFPTQIYGMFTSDAEVIEIGNSYLPIAILIFFGSALRAIANALINGSGNYKINFVTAILDGIVLRIGYSVLFGLVLDMREVGFWLGDALAGFTPFLIGVVFYFTGLWKKEKRVERGN